MNLLFSLTAYPPSIGGAQNHMHQLARALMARHSLRVVSHWDENRTDWLLGTTLKAPFPEHAYTIDGVPVTRITLTQAARRKLLPWVLAYYPLQGAAIDHIAQELLKEILPLADGVELVHNCRIGREGLSFASLALARRMDIPFVLTPVHHPRWSSWLHRHYQQLYRQADAVIALTRVESDELVRLGVDDRRVHITGIGPILAQDGDANRFRTQNDLGDAPFVLFLGQKYAYKGMAPLLAAAEIVWQSMPEVRFVFIGPRTEYSRQLFSTVSDARILELDSVDLQTKTDALAACTLLCVPSSQESFGGVYTEAWSLGKPVVGCSIPAVSEVIADGVDGVLTTQEPATLADSIRSILSDPALASRMGESGRVKVAERFTWERIASLTEQVYEGLIG